jgi:lysozyme family protein
LALFHFDTAVNMGVGTAARMLQTALGVDADGEIGPITLATASRADPPRVLAAYAALRRTRYRSLSTFRRFGRGCSPASTGRSTTRFRFPRSQQPKDSSP